MQLSERSDGGVDVDAWDQSTCLTPEALGSLVAAEVAQVTLVLWAENQGEASYRVTGYDPEHGCLQAVRAQV